SSFPRPIPAHECSVHPSIFTEAMPVDAVMASFNIGRSRSSCHDELQPQERNIPADPVKKMLLPDSTSFRMALCSGDSALSNASLTKLGGSGGGATSRLEALALIRD
ncbi:hypothetical protein FOMPIDRAFT_1113807, partial [Fomitopsis schrenkii]